MVPRQERFPLKINGVTVVGKVEYFISRVGGTTAGVFYITERTAEDIEALRRKSVEELILRKGGAGRG